MIVRKPFQFMVTLVNRAWVQTNGLIVGTIAESSTIPDKQLGIEAPANNRRGNDVVITVSIRSLGNIKKVSASA